MGDVDLWLGDEVDRAELQRGEGDVGASLGERRAHDHRHWPQPHQVAQELQAVHARHFHIERQYVRIEYLDLFARYEGIRRRTDDLQRRVGPENLRQQRAHQCRIVDDQHLDALFWIGLRCHRYLPCYPWLSEQLDVAANRRAIDIAHVARLIRDHATVAARQALHLRAAGGRVVQHLARVQVAQILAHHPEAFGLYVFLHEADVAGADIRQRIQYLAAADQLYFKVSAPTAELENLVDQPLHGDVAEARRGTGRATPGSVAVRAIHRQHEMIHAPDTQAAVADAGGDARPQHAADQLAVGGNVVVAWVQRGYHGIHAGIETPLYVTELLRRRQRQRRQRRRIHQASLRWMVSLTSWYCELTCSSDSEWPRIR